MLVTQPPGLGRAVRMHLQRAGSVGLQSDGGAARAKWVVARVRGGASEWKDGFEQYAARRADAGVAFAALPGDDKPDPDLRLFSTVCDQDYDALWAYLVEGGPKNAVNFLGYCQHMIAQTPMHRRPNRCCAPGSIGLGLAFRIYLPRAPIGQRMHPLFP